MIKYERMNINRAGTVEKRLFSPKCHVHSIFKIKITRKKRTMLELTFTEHKHIVEKGKNTRIIEQSGFGTFER